MNLEQAHEVVENQIIDSQESLQRARTSKSKRIMKNTLAFWKAIKKHLKPIK